MGDGELLTGRGSSASDSDIVAPRPRSNRLRNEMLRFDERNYEGAADQRRCRHSRSVNFTRCNTSAARGHAPRTLRNCIIPCKTNFIALSLVVTTTRGPSFSNRIRPHFIHALLTSHLLGNASAVERRKNQNLRSGTDGTKPTTIQPALLPPNPPRLFTKTTHTTLQSKFNPRP